MLRCKLLCIIKPKTKQGEIQTKIADRRNHAVKLYGTLYGLYPFQLSVLPALWLPAEKGYQMHNILVRFQFVHIVYNTHTNGGVFGGIVEAVDPNKHQTLPVYHYGHAVVMNTGIFLKPSWCHLGNSLISRDSDSTSTRCFRCFICQSQESGGETDPVILFIIFCFKDKLRYRYFSPHNNTNPD